MKTVKPKQIRTVGSKPKKTPVKLSKSDPDYYAKIGAISAAKRKLTSEDFAEMARKSHPRKLGHQGGRPKNA